LLKKSADIYTTPKVKLWPGYLQHQNDGRAGRQQRQKKNCEFSQTGNIPSTLLRRSRRRNEKENIRKMLQEEQHNIFTILYTLKKTKLL
jgi:hypothetical protein